MLKDNYLYLEHMYLEATISNLKQINPINYSFLSVLLEKLVFQNVHIQIFL